MNLIAAVDNKWGIGLNRELLVRIPADQKLFRQETMGKVIVLGHRTLRTFPQGMPLAGRKNIVLSRDTFLIIKGATVVHSVDELLEVLKPYRAEDIYVVGGESIYRQLLPYCDTAHLTIVDHVYEADAHFPNLDLDPDWEKTDESDEHTYFDLAYTFVRYERKTTRETEA